MNILGYFVFVLLLLYMFHTNIRLRKFEDYKKYLKAYDELYPIRNRTSFSSQNVTLGNFKKFFMSHSIDELKFQKYELKAILEDMKQYSVMSIGITIFLAFIGYIFSNNKIHNTTNEIEIFGETYLQDALLFSISVILYLISIIVIFMYILKHLLNVKKLSLLNDILEEHLKLRGMWDEKHSEALINRD